MKILIEHEIKRDYGIYTKKNFIDAYIFYYGGTKKNALEAYKSSSEEYVKNLIDGYMGQAKSSFYND